MNGKRFGHFEMFKIALNTVYIASGFVIFGALISNASIEYNKNNEEIHILQENFYGNEECMNCDEID